MKHVNKHPECPSASRTIEVNWSDRVSHVDPTDAEAVTNVIVNCALDHYYDSSVVPYNLPGRDELLPIITRYLDAIAPDWRNCTIELTSAQYTAFRADVLKAVENHIHNNRPTAFDPR